MTTNNAVNVGLSGSTGTGNFVGATSPTLVTPTIGAATSTTITFSPTTGGIVGTTTNDNTNAGNVGEFVSSNIAQASQISLSSTVAANITSISLTAGDWDVGGLIVYQADTSTTTTLVNGGISTTSATFAAPNPSSATNCALAATFATTATFSFSTAPLRLSLSGTTTVYLIVRATFAVSTANAYGYISARRVR